MEKVKLTAEEREQTSFEYNGQRVIVDSFMGIAQQATLIKRYVDDYFAENPERLILGSEYNYLEAEYNLMDYIIQDSTNIDTEDLEEDVYVNSNIFDRVSGLIQNYGAFKERLYKVVQDVKEQKAIENSAGKIVGDLVKKAYGLLDELAKLNPEEISKIQDVGKELIEELKKNSIVA